jgi:hypothetical protein
MDKDPIYLCTFLMLALIGIGALGIFFPWRRRSK